jgi:ribonucleoside-diphosphate reductase alpha chain
MTTGLEFGRHFSDGKNPFNTVEWETRDAQITDAKGAMVFEQKGIDVPKDWSMTATNITASKYFHGKIGTPERESSVSSLIARVVSTITSWGKKDGYFKTERDAQIFTDELATLLVKQYGAFNSPVWFNVGCDALEPESKTDNWHWDYAETKVRFDRVGYSRPQCSACFINSVKDDMVSILELAKTEGMLFKWGSGTGTNLSPLRADGELLAGGGTASGPISFMKGFDAFAGVIKSGGKTRRAAKMVILNADHPDIEAFIECKGKEEAKAHALISVGYDGSGPESEAYNSIFFQNANNSVRVTDDFMKSAVEGGGVDDTWPLTARTNAEPLRFVSAEKLLDKMAKEAWSCGDPGIQFDSKINEWHTCKRSGRINASNPCSEFMFLDDTACNLASLNLLKFLKEDGTFDVTGFVQAVHLFIVAQDILIDNSGYPTEAIAKNSHDFRPIGLGYANLGAMLMAMGVPYDSDQGRGIAAAITAIMTGTAYARSAHMAASLPRIEAAGEFDSPLVATFPGYWENRESMAEVIAKHTLMARTLYAEIPEYLREAACDSWGAAGDWGRKVGFRNSQVTVLAPTGTIGFMMDCDTTGVEPLLGLVVFKKLVGGGFMKLPNGVVPRALRSLGYTQFEADGILKHVQDFGTVEASTLDKDHLDVFDCALRPQQGKRSIAWTGHIRMMEVVQPFLSGAISKTVNMPEETTVEDVKTAYIEAWRRGLKSVAIYRDGSKKNQVLVTKRDESKDMGSIMKTATALEDPLGEVARIGLEASDQKQSFYRPPKTVETIDMAAPPKAVRHKLPDERMALTHKFNIAGHEGYLTIGLYANGQPGEIFITMSKEGSTMSGLMDSFAMVVSVALQHGVALTTLIDKLAHTRFEPSGWSQNQQIGYAKSIMDYIFRYLEQRFVKGEQLSFFAQTPPANAVVKEVPQVEPKAEYPVESLSVLLGMESGHAADKMAELMDFGDAPSCSVCGAIMARNGSCYKCMSCGSTSGCS